MLSRKKFLGGENRLRMVLGGAGRGEKHSAFGIEAWIGHIDFEEETIELGLGERISSFLLDRVLRGENVKGTGEIVPNAGDGYVLFLHSLEERRLRARTCPVDLIGHQ